LGITVVTNGKIGDILEDRREPNWEVPRAPAQRHRIFHESLQLVIPRLISLTESGPMLGVAPLETGNWETAH
jgi:hypothetical protein